MPPTYLGHGRRHGLGQRCGIWEHLSPTYNLSQALIAGLPVKLNSAQLRRQADQCLWQIMCRRLNVHICRSVVPGSVGGRVPGRSAAYENQALNSAQLRRPAGCQCLRKIMCRRLNVHICRSVVSGRAGSHVPGVGRRHMRTIVYNLLRQKFSPGTIFFLAHH